MMVVDLDEAPAVPARARPWTRWPASTPRWVTGPVGSIAIAVVAAALVGAVVARHERSAGAERALGVQAATSLVVDRLEIDGMDRFNETSAGRWIPLDPTPEGDASTHPAQASFSVYAALVNQGTRPLTIIGAALAVPRQDAGLTPQLVAIGPGLGDGVLVPVRVRCAGVPEHARPSTASWTLVVRLRLGDRTATQHMHVPSGAAFELAERESATCHP